MADFQEDSGDDAADILLPQMNEDRLFDAINTAVDDAPYSSMTPSSEQNGADFVSPYLVWYMNIEQNFEVIQYTIWIYKVSRYKILC